MMKKLGWLSAALFFAVIAAAGTVPRYLVTGDDPSRLEKRAEQELKHFYKLIYGRDLVVIPESQSAGKPAVYLGRTKFAAENKVDFASFDQEEWLLKTSGDSLIVAGGRPAGTLYGVYRMLEKLGVAFLTPDETVIPKPGSDFPVFDERRKPAFVGRVIYDGIPRLLMRGKYGKNRASQWASPEVIDAYLSWRLRSRINGSTSQALPPYYVGKIYNLCHWPEWHTMSLYVNPKLYDTHPEYFAMDREGRRVKPRSFTMRGDVCMSSPEVRKVALASLREMIRRNRAAKSPEEWSVVYDVTRLDDTPEFCQCPACRKISEYDGSDTGLLVDFSNYLARNIRKEYPDVIIRIQGHATHGRKLPNKIIPEKNILFRLCDTFSTRDPFRPIEKAKNPEAISYFETWTKFGTPHVKMLWDYWNLGGSYFQPPRVESVFDALKPDFLYFLRHGINALFIEASMDAYSPQNFMMLNYFVACRLMVDPEEDPEALARLFIRHYYGEKAAPVMYEYFRLIREGVAKDPQKPSSSQVSEWQFATPDFMLGLYKAFTRAAETSSPRHARRIRSELITPIWSVLVRWPNYEKTFTAAGIGREQLVEECRKYVHDHIRRFPCEKPEKGDKLFEDKFRNAAFLPVLPPRFKDIPTFDLRVATFADFHPSRGIRSMIVDDPDSPQGRAVKSAHPDPACHGVNKIMPGKHRFRTTGFYMSSGGKKIGLVLKKVPQDEKYHWYRIPGKIVLDVKSNFWGHGWGINARVNHWYKLTYGDPKDNTWEQIWFSAKFTGPAYVSGSKKDNAIYVDTVVAVRHDGAPQKENRAKPK
ncbi:MAG: DUF4838 domain-containing protein [Lentisphaeria bacterium]|nr:DUF4838 domain-containing protein [Lentisphaeria bacterium]